jgi:hypothetical protein
MEGMLFWPPERHNVSKRPGFAVFGGQFIPRVTPCQRHPASSVKKRLFKEEPLK